MSTWIVFLRAINLGATRKFPKGDIVAATETAGFTGVATHINTGNVRLETGRRSRATIESMLEGAYLADRGFAVPAIAFTVRELRAVLADADELARGAGKHYVSLLKQEPDAAAARALEERSTDEEVVRVRGRAVHLMLTTSYHEATLSNAAAEKALGVATNRNLTVVRAIVDKWC